MERTKIKYENAIGDIVIGYAWLDTDSDFVWCFDDKTTEFGFTIHRSQIVKVYKK